MDIIYINCICENNFKVNIVGDGWISCPFCKRKIYRKFDGKEETYVLLSEEEIKNDRRYRTC